MRRGQLVQANRLTPLRLGWGRTDLVQRGTVATVVDPLELSTVEQPEPGETTLWLVPPRWGCGFTSFPEDWTVIAEPEPLDE